MDGNAVANSAKQYIILKFDNEQYGIDITYIDNIVRLQKITRVPHAPVSYTHLRAHED